jgi:hypothetical protein
MLRTITVFLVTFIGLSAFAHGSVHAQSRTELKNDFGIELLGKAVIYSFSYQRMINSKLGLQVGVSALGGTNAPSIAFIPVGARYYVRSKNSSPFLTAGFVGLTGSVGTGPDKLSGWTSYGYVGSGFEFRSSDGFLFRATGYTLFRPEGYFFWPGLSVGYAF